LESSRTLKPPDRSARKNADFDLPPAGEMLLAAIRNREASAATGNLLHRSGAQEPSVIRTINRNDMECGGKPPLRKREQAIALQKSFKDENVGR